MASAPSPRRFYHFGEFRLDVRSGELFKNGAPVRLPPQPAKLLLFLVEARGELVTREEVQKALWDDDTIVDFEQGINKAIKQIRAALEDTAEEPLYIQTVSRRGYRFLGDARVKGVEPAILEVERSPYPGLSPFTEKDAPFFFGREEEIESLWRKVETKRLLALIGPSGAGKSSFLRAGLVPGTPRGFRTLVVQLREKPFTALARALEAELADGGSSNRSELDLLWEWRRAHPESLLCIDAFEELFTLNDESTREKFCELIGTSVNEIGIRTLLVMRDDFLIHSHDYTELEPVFSDLTPLKPPRGPGLRRALVEPAGVYGYRFEDEGLVGEILAEVSKERGAFPLLAFAAARLWEKRDRARKLLTREAYLEIGGVGGALAQHAEATFAGIGLDGEPIVREIFRNLTTAKGTRAAQEREELLSVFENRQEASTVLQRLIDGRLLTSTNLEIELAHESLLSAWPRLVRWQAQDAEGAVLRDQLRHASRAWQERTRPDDLLWTGTSYRDLTQWRERHPVGLTATEQSFADASARLAERKRRRQRIALASVLAAALTVAAITSWFWRQARAEALRAEASKLLALAELRLEDDPTEALAFSIASLELHDSQEARVFAMKALWEAPPAFELDPDSQAVRVPEFSPDGKWLATAGHSEEALVWSQDGGDPMVLPGHESRPLGPNFAAWASNDLLVTGPNKMVGSRVHLWSLPKGTLERTIDFGGPTYWQMGEKELLTETLEEESADEPGVGVLRSWVLPHGRPTLLGRIESSKRGESEFFSPDGNGYFFIKDRSLYSRPLRDVGGIDRFVAGLDADVEWVWTSFKHVSLADKSGETHFLTFPSEGQAQKRVIPKYSESTLRIAPEPSGRWLSGLPSVDQGVRLWDLDAWNAARPLSLRRSGSWFLAVIAFHPLREWVVASTDRFTRLTFWPLKKTYASVVDGYTSRLRPLAFSPDGKWLATMWADDRLRLWPVHPSTGADVRLLEGPNEPLRSIAFDPGANYLTTAGSVGQSWIVPLDGSAPRRLEGTSAETSFNVAAVSPSGRQVATAFFYGGGEKTLRIWNAETGALRQLELPKGSEGTTGYERGISSLAFANEATLYTMGDGGLRRWNLETGSQELVSESSAGYRNRGAFDADATVALTAEWRQGWNDCPRALLHDLVAGTAREVTEFGDCGAWSRIALDPSGAVAATGSFDGIVRVGRLAGGEPHILMGHEGALDSIAISPDLRWVATSGEDNTLRLWPMPDLSKPPLHTLPHEELLAKLKSLTNLRAVRDPSSSTGWKIEVGRFPGWRDVPVW
jgi:WD40 repeat protein/DNA-binding winged helix-turn-helix (wHTH) protein